MNEADTRLGRDRLTILGIAAVAFFMEQLDATALNTAIPTIAETFGVAPIRLNIAVTSYILALAAGIPVSGWMADRFGARRVFACAIACFALASLACGLSESLPMLVVARCAQGLAGSMMSPIGRLLVLRILPKRMLATGFAYLAIPALIGPALGPVLGGLLSEYISWRWIFYINLPIALAGIVALFRFVPDMPAVRPGKFDVTGFAFCGAGFVAAQFTFENIGRGDFPAWSLVLSAAVTLAAFILYRRHARRHDAPLLDPSIFRRRSFRVSQTAGALARGGMQAMPFLLPLFFQIGLGMSPLRAGIYTAVTALGAMGIRAFMAALLRWLGFDRLMIWASIYAAIVVALFTQVDASTSLWLLIPLLAAFGIARAIHFSANAMLGYSGIPQRLMSNANTFVSVIQQLSQGFGISFVATVLSLAAGANAQPDRGDFAIGFLAIACFPLIAITGYRTLWPHDGAEASQHPRALEYRTHPER